MAASILFLTCFNMSNFPIPTGSYAVGKIDYHLVDASRVETNNQGAKREIMLHIWYPASRHASLRGSYYDKDALSTVQEFINQQGNIPLWLLKGISFTRTYSHDNAPVSESKDVYPVIIATHGSGTMVQHYTSLWEELASQGYIVVGIDHPYIAALTRFPDGHSITSLINAKRKETKEAKNAWKQEQFEVAVADVKFVLDSLTELNIKPQWPLYNKLDLSRVGICAHSSGGSLAMRMSLEDKRIKAVAALDSSVRGNYNLTPLSIPTLVLLAEKSHVLSGEEGKKALQDLKTLCYKSKPFMTLITFNSVGHGTPH
jgi:predicted dienelactone hydrolase